MWCARGARLWRNLERTRCGSPSPQPAGASLSLFRSFTGFRATDSALNASFLRPATTLPLLARSEFSVSFARHYTQTQLEGEANDGSDEDNESLLPKVEGKPEEVIKAFPREGSGKNVSKRSRRSGQAPSIVFSQENGHLGGDKRLITVETKQIERLLKRFGQSFFLSKTFDLETCDEEGNSLSREHVLPRSIHLHAGNDKLLNVTFIRAPPTAVLKVNVPLVFIGEDACPGIRKGGRIYTMMRTVKYECPGDAIPQFIEVDLSSLDMGEKILLSDLKVPTGIKLVKKDSSLPVCKVMGNRTSAAAAGVAAAAS